MGRYSSERTHPAIFVCVVFFGLGLDGTHQLSYSSVLLDRHSLRTQLKPTRHLKGRGARPVFQLEMSEDG